MLLCQHEPEMKDGEPLRLYLIGEWGSPPEVAVEGREIRVVHVCRRCGVVYSAPETKTQAAERHKEQDKMEQEVNMAKNRACGVWVARNKEHNIKPSITDAYTDGFYDGIAWAQSQG